jgi:mRNA interferase MazF
VPITDWKPQYAAYIWFVVIPADSTNSLAKESGADAFQVKSLSLARFSRRLGSARPAQVEAVASAIGLCVGAP